MKTVISYLILAMIFVVGFCGAAWAASGATVDASTATDALGAVLAAFQSGDYGVGALLTVVLITAVLRKYGSKKWPWLGGDVGGSVLVLVSAYAGALAAALASDTALTWGLAWSTFKLAAMAAGGYTLIKRVVGAVLDKAAPWIPGWLQALLKGALALFGRSPEAAIADAERANRAAVKASPSGGIITGRLP